MNHAALAISLATLLGCSERPSAPSPAKPAEATPAASASSRPAAVDAHAASAPQPLPAGALYPGAVREVGFPGRPVRLAWLQAANEHRSTSLVVASPRGETIVVKDLEGAADDHFGLIVRGDRVVALATRRSLKTERSLVSAWLLAVTPANEVVIADAFQSEGPASPLPQWLPEAVRQREAAAPMQAGDEPMTDEEAEEAAMTDAVEDFGAAEPSTVGRAR